MKGKTSRCRRAGLRPESERQDDEQPIDGSRQRTTHSVLVWPTTTSTCCRGRTGECAEEQDGEQELTLRGHLRHTAHIERRRRHRAVEAQSRSERRERWLISEELPIGSDAQYSHADTSRACLRVARACRDNDRRRCTCLSHENKCKRCSA
jgi:hypothetical protein